MKLSKNVVKKYTIFCGNFSLFFFFLQDLKHFFLFFFSFFFVFVRTPIRLANHDTFLTVLFTPTLDFTTIDIELYVHNEVQNEPNELERVYVKIIKEKTKELLWDLYIMLLFTKGCVTMVETPTLLHATFSVITSYPGLDCGRFT